MQEYKKVLSQYGANSVEELTSMLKNSILSGLGY